jgi:hypothetical protein
MRPRYETDADLAAEMAIATAWASTVGVEPHKLPSGPRYSVDFCFMKGVKTVAFGEIKDRKGWKPEYGTIILGFSKVQALWNLHNMGWPSYFIVRLPDGIYFVRIDDRIKLWEVGIMGRTDRGDKNDVEPCYRIRFGDLTKCNFQEQ